MTKNFISGTEHATIPINALLIEDNPGDVFLLRQMLREFTTPAILLHDVERLRDGFRQLEEQHFDVVLLDLSLPDSQGYETFERLHQQVFQLPIIVLTGFDDEKLALRAVRAGAQDYLVKGEINEQLLMRAIRYAIERKRTEETLRESQMRYRSLFENANTGIFLITLDGFYVNVNQQAAAMLGYTVNELIGQEASHFFRDETQLDFRAQSQELLAEQVIPIYECEVQRQDGSMMPLELNVTLVRDSFDKPLYIQSIARDISRRRKVEQALSAERTLLAKRVAERTTELRVANSELMRNARLKDEFLATVSHELRTPLSVILTLSEALQESVYGTVSETQQKALRRIRKSGRHLLALINDVLDVSKIESGKLDLEIGPTSVHELCEDCFQMVQEAATSKQIALRAALDPAVAIIAADGRRLMQVLLNLLNNAIKFTPDGGTVTLSVSADAAAQIVSFAVRDTGIGILHEDLPRLFQPFVQLDSRLSRRYQGAGLGLALVYRLVKLHGGSVSVESKVGEGSLFTVALPWRDGTYRAFHDVDNDMAAFLYAKDEQEQENEPLIKQSRRQDGASIPEHRSTVLLVEDHLAALEAMENYLSVNHYHVLSARSGVEALALARENRLDLILMDIQMPEMDGLEAIQTLRQQINLADTPIIALTALAMPGDRERCIAAGATVYMSKPLSLQNLRHTMDELLRQPVSLLSDATHL